MNFQLPHQNLSAGVLGGTFLSAVTHIGSEDIVTTIVLAILGAIVSFIASVMTGQKHYNLSTFIRY